MTHILVTGANGQLGKTFRNLQFDYPDFKFHFVSKDDIDISNKGKVEEFMAEKPIDWIINCAAYTKVDLAETESELCFKINETGPYNLAKVANDKGIKLVHISSDYVYHSNFGTPFTEEAITNPQSVYAKSKLAGDQAVTLTCPEHYILRTSWVYAEHGNNFVRTMLRLGMERDNLSIVCDQIGTPTYTGDLARAIMSLISSGKNAYGIYNFANDGQTSWYNLARAIHINQDIDCLITPIRTDEYPTAASRPPYSVMNLNKIKQTFDIEIRDWEEALYDCLQKVEMPV